MFHAETESSKLKRRKNGVYRPGLEETRLLQTVTEGTRMLQAEKERAQGHQAGKRACRSDPGWDRGS